MNKLIIFFTMVVMLDSCAQSNNKLDDSNCIVSKEKMEQLLKGYKPILSTESTKDLSVNFINNPYSLDNTYNFALILGNKTVIYKGEFKQNLKITIPSICIGRLNELKFILSGNGNSYVFNTNVVAKMNETDNDLQIVFVPKESDWFSFYFNFSNTEDIIQGP